MNLMRRFWRSTLLFIVGTSDDPLRQIHNGFLFLGTVFIALSVWINETWHLTPVWFNLFLLVLMIPALGLWIWSRFFRLAYRRAGLAFAILLAVFVLPITWFANGGMNGPTLLFYLATLLYVGGLLQGQRQLAIITIGLISLSPIVLIMLEIQHQDWVHAYADVQSRALDLSLSFLLVLVMLSIMLTGHFRRYSTELKRSEKLTSRLRHLADHDGLTRLLNHRAGHERAETLHAGGELYALLFCDLDHFKLINDRYGHPFGDRTLRQFARILQNTCEHFDAECARYGGEEFLVMLKHKERDICEIDRHLREQIKNISMPDGKAAFSSGATLISTNETIDTALTRADHALYEAKNAGRNRLVVMSHECRPSMQPRVDKNATEELVDQ